MLDPVTALGLAGNVIQFISFAHELVTEGSQVYHAVDGVLVENRDTEALTSDLSKLTIGLSESQTKWLDAHRGAQLDADEVCLRNICERCTEIAGELNVQLQKVKLHRSAGTMSRSNNLQRIAKSGKQAIISAWRKDARDQLATRLESYRREIDTRVLFSLRKSLQASDIRSSQQFADLDQRTRDLIVTITLSGDKIDGRLDDQTVLLSQLTAEQIRGNQMLLTIVDTIERKSLAPERAISDRDRALVATFRATPLHEAAEIGDALKVRQLLRSPLADVGSRDEHGCTPLHLASTAEVAKRLLNDKRVDHYADNYEGQTVLHCAVLKRRLDVVKVLLEAGIDVTVEDDCGKTASFYGEDCPTAAWLLRYGPAVEAVAKDHLDNTGLMHMAWLGDVEGTQFFLAQGANVNARNKFQETALTEAARHGDCDVVVALLDAGADMEIAASGEWTPLLQAVRGDRAEVVSLLLDKGANKEATLRNQNTHLAEACVRSYFDIARILIEHGCNVNAQDPMQNTPLLQAAYRGTPRFVRWLLERGADPSVINNEGETAVYRASRGGHAKTLQALLEHGPRTTLNLARAEPHEYTPMSIAAQKGHYECVKLLLTYGADPNAQGHLGHTPLAYTAHHGLIEAAKLLLDHGAKVDVPTEPGFTALSVAAHHGKDDIVRLLADAGADIEARGFGHKNSDRSTTPLMRAARFGHASTAALLVELGANVNAHDNCDRTALHFAAQELHTSVIDVLIKKGADVNLRDVAGKTALMHAGSKGSEEIVRLLVEANANLRLRDQRGCTAWIIARHSGNDRKLRDLLEPSSHEDQTLLRLQAERHPGEIAAYINEVRH